MKLIYVFAILLLFGPDPGKIGKTNTAKAKAKEAFIGGDYKTAISQYKYLTDSLGVKEDEVMMNLAHSYFNLNDTSNAMASYQKLLSSAKKTLKSNAYQQLGVLNNRQGRLEEALTNFKEALKTDPTNEDARYDYEMVKKKLEEKKKKEEQNKQNEDKKDEKNKDQEKKENKDQKDQKDQQNKDQEKKDQEKKEQEQKEKAEKEKREKEKKEKEAKDKEEQNKEEEKDKKDNFNPDKMKDMKVSEEKAKMILEAMKNQEVQYLQQNKRKATKPKDKGKPDW